MADSFRVVNQGAPVYFKPTARDYNGEEIGIESYRKADTTEIDKDWKPEDYNQIKANNCPDFDCNQRGRNKNAHCSICKASYSLNFDSSFSACLEALGRVK